MIPASANEKKWMKEEYDKIDENIKKTFLHKECPYCEKESYFDTVHDSEDGSCLVCMNCITKFTKDELE